MFVARIGSFTLIAVVAVAFAPAHLTAAGFENTDPRVLQEDFVQDPIRSGWTVFGSPELFRWDTTRQILDVTWDSAQPNTFFSLPLGTELTRRDDFSAALRLTLRDLAAGAGEGKPGTFQIAFGFHNHAEAVLPGFVRGTGSDSPDLVEFNFFPDTGYGPTVWPGIFPSHGGMNYNGRSDFSLFELPIGVPILVTLDFNSTNETASIAVTTNGVLVGPVTSARLGPRFTDFRVDTFAISSYADEGQLPFMPGSVLAHAEVDSVRLTIPPPPLRFESGAWLEGRWTQRVLSRARWTYELEASEDLRLWAAVSAPVPGTGDFILLREDEPSAAPHRFFRVRAFLPN